MNNALNASTLATARIVLARTVPGRLKHIAVEVGTTAYFKSVGGSCAPAGLWHTRCSLYSDSPWLALRADSDEAVALDAHFADVLTAHAVELATNG